MSEADKGGAVPSMSWHSLKAAQSTSKRHLFWKFLKVCSAEAYLLTQLHTFYLNTQASHNFSSMSTPGKERKGNPRRGKESMHRSFSLNPEDSPG
jgi:hypothetical protein